MRGAQQVGAATRRFDLRGRLGDGGGGIVYRAYDHKLGREVALKFMHDREGDELVRFCQSFAALRRLAHPNLVQLYDLVDEGERALLVMELIEGVDLLRYVRQDQGSYDELRVRAAFGQLAQGLDALHREHKVHRDVKPANVRVTPQGRIVLLDLDLAIDLDIERSERARGHPAPRPVGTPAYMAPEQAASARLSPACDWYSMGVVLYEALTGIRPYRGSELEVLLQKQEARPVPPEQLAPDLPRDLARLCGDLLAPDPAERPSGPEILRRLGVHEDVLSSRWTSASLLSAHAAFVGREPELARIQQCFERSRSGALVLRVSGAEGCGKTTLCEEALRRMVRADARALVLASSCPRYPDHPHAALHEPIARITESLREGRPLVRSGVSASGLRLLERAFPGAGVGIEPKTQGRSAPPPEPLEQRWRAIVALRTLVAELAAVRPVVLWLDDYQRADLDTQRFLASLVAGPDAPPFLLVLSAEPQPGLALDWLPEAHETLALGELTSNEGNALLAELLERVGEPGRLELAREAERSPLAIRERVRHALLLGEVPPERADYAMLIERRLRELSEPARRVLELVCAAFDPIPQPVCEQAAELTPAEFTRQVAALSIAGLVCRKPALGQDGLAPGHPLLAEHVDRALEGPRRVAIHQRLASAFAARDAQRVPGRLLRHQGECGEHTRAADNAELAGVQAYEALAFQRAAELFTLSIALKPLGRDDRGVRLSRRLGEALAHAGWVLSAAGAYRDAAEFASAAEALHMRQRSIENLLRGAEVEEGVRAMRELLASLGAKIARSPERAAWSLGLHRLGLRLFGFGFREREEGQIPASELRRVDVLFACGLQLSLIDAVSGADLLCRALAAARELGEPSRIARALCVEACSFVGDRGRAGPLLEAARSLTERHEAPLLNGHVRLAQGVAAFSGFQLRECSAHCRDAERVFRDSCAQAGWELSAAQMYQALAGSLGARYGELAPKLALCRREAEERGDVWSQSALLGVEALGLSLARDAPEQAREQLREGASRWGARGTLHAQALLSLFGHTAADLYEGREQTLPLLEQRLAECQLKQFLYAPFVRISLTELCARARLFAQARAREPASLRAIEAGARRLLRERDQAALGFGQLVLANLHALREQPGQAARALELAQSALDPLGLGQWLWPARFALGRVQGGTRGRALAEAARAQLVQNGVQRPERFAAMMLPGFRFD